MGDPGGGVRGSAAAAAHRCSPVEDRLLQAEAAGRDAGGELAQKWILGRGSLSFLISQLLAIKMNLQ